MQNYGNIMSCVLQNFFCLRSKFGAFKDENMCALRNQLENVQKYRSSLFVSCTEYYRTFQRYWYEDVYFYCKLLQKL